MTAPVATWKYSKGVLEKLSVPTGILEFDPSVNPGLHAILLAPQFSLDPAYEDDYNAAPANAWAERDIKWGQAQNDPPVLQVEQTIGGADHVSYTIEQMEDRPNRGQLLQDISDLMDDIIANGSTKAKIRQIEEKRLEIWKRTGIV